MKELMEVTQDPQKCLNQNFGLAIFQTPSVYLNKAATLYIYALHTTNPICTMGMELKCMGTPPCFFFLSVLLRGTTSVTSCLLA